MTAVFHNSTSRPLLQRYFATPLTVTRSTRLSTIQTMRSDHVRPQATSTTAKTMPLYRGTVAPKRRSSSEGGDIQHGDGLQHDKIRIQVLVSEGRQYNRPRTTSGPTFSMTRRGTPNTTYPLVLIVFLDKLRGPVTFCRYVVP